MIARSQWFSISIPNWILNLKVLSHFSQTLITLIIQSTPLLDRQGCGKGSKSRTPVELPEVQLGRQQRQRWLPLVDSPCNRLEQKTHTRRSTLPPPGQRHEPIAHRSRRRPPRLDHCTLFMSYARMWVTNNSNCSIVLNLMCLLLCNYVRAARIWIIVAECWSSGCVPRELSERDARRVYTGDSRSVVASSRQTYPREWHLCTGLHVSILLPLCLYWVIQLL